MCTNAQYDLDSIVDSYASYAASAIAAKTLMRSLVGASVPLWVTQMFHNMGFQYAGLLLALVSCVILVIHRYIPISISLILIFPLFPAHSLPLFQVWQADPWTL